MDNYEDDKMDLDEEGENINTLDGSNDGTPQAVPDTSVPAEPETTVVDTLPKETSVVAPEISEETAAARARRLRPRAEDMFASDGE